MLMALEQQLSLGPTVDAQTDGATNGVEFHHPPTTDAIEDGVKAPRLPRWTRQEILVLIHGKRDAETQIRGSRGSGLPFGSSQLEPKWASVSSYCKKHGVNRGPVQCRKRWSNLAGDYKKIKEWESQRRDDSESFWVMRNDVRREKKLPGFFDREVYDILDLGSPAAAAVRRRRRWRWLWRRRRRRRGKRLMLRLFCMIAGAPPEKTGCFRILKGRRPG